MRGAPGPRASPPPTDGPGQAFAPSPDSGSAADTAEKKAEGKWKCPDLFGSRGGGRGRRPPRVRKHKPDPSAWTARGGNLARVAKSEEAPKQTPAPDRGG